MARQNGPAAQTQNPKLRELLNTLVPKILKYRDHHIGEEDTKAMLVNPVLEALGWRIDDPDEVSHEFKARPESGYNPVDYALRVEGKTVLIIEAKRLGEKLEKWITQLFGNTSVAGRVDWCVLTDGDEYRIYKANVAEDADMKLFRKVRISEEGKDDFTVDTLSLLSRSNMAPKPRIDTLWAVEFVDRRVKTALNDMLNPQENKGHEGLIRLIRKAHPELQSQQITESLRRLDVRIETPTVRPAASPKPSSPIPGREIPEIDVEALRQRQQAGEPIAALAREAGIPWQRLWEMLKNPSTSPKPGAGPKPKA